MHQVALEGHRHSFRPPTWTDGVVPIGVRVFVAKHLVDRALLTLIFCINQYNAIVQLASIDPAVFATLFFFSTFPSSYTTTTCHHRDRRGRSVVHLLSTAAPHNHTHTHTIGTAHRESRVLSLSRSLAPISLAFALELGKPHDV